MITLTVQISMADGSLSITRDHVKDNANSNEIAVFNALAASLEGWIKGVEDAVYLRHKLTIDDAEEDK